jgi:hypothetical protein
LVLDLGILRLRLHFDGFPSGAKWRPGFEFSGLPLRERLRGSIAGSVFSEGRLFFGVAFRGWDDGSECLGLTLLRRTRFGPSV